MQGLYAKMSPDPLISFLDEIFLYEALFLKLQRCVSQKKKCK